MIPIDANSLLRDCLILWRKKEHDKLFALSIELIKSYPEWGPAWRYKGLALYMQKLPALIEFKKALQFNDRLAPAWLQIVSDACDKKPIHLPSFKQIEQDMRNILDPEQKYPRRIGIETQAICNARCTFCPYHKSFSRKGKQMPDELFHKIIDELVSFPQELPLIIEPHLLAEPFLDKRLLPFCKIINQKLPQASIVITSNGSLFSREIMEQLSDVTISSISISLNEHDASRYQNLMGLHLDKTLANLDALHALSYKKNLPEITIGRVRDFSPNDDSFAHFITERYPNFILKLKKPLLWTGDLKEKESIPNKSCWNWTAMTIMCTGEVAMCCIDGEGNYTVGNLNTQSILEIYNAPRFKQFRMLTDRRQSPAPCNMCTSG